MALVTIYDADGVEYQKETVDARECVEVLGFSYEKPEAKEVSEESVKQIRQKKATEEVVN